MDLHEYRGNIPTDPRAIFERITELLYEAHVGESSPSNPEYLCRFGIAGLKAFPDCPSDLKAKAFLQIAAIFKLAIGIAASERAPGQMAPGQPAQYLNLSEILSDIGLRPEDLGSPAIEGFKQFLKYAENSSSNFSPSASQNIVPTVTNLFNLLLPEESLLSRIVFLTTRVINAAGYRINLSEDPINTAESSTGVVHVTLPEPDLSKRLREAEYRASSILAGLRSDDPALKFLALRHLGGMVDIPANYDQFSELKFPKLTTLRELLPELAAPYLAHGCDVELATYVLEGMSALRVHPVDLTDRIAEIGLQLARRSPPPAGAILACLNSLEILGTKADGDVNQLRREVGGLLERIKREEDVSEEAYRLFDLAETRGIDPRSIDPCLYLSDFPDDVKLVLAASFADRVYDPDELVQFLPWLKEGLHYFSRPENASYGYTIVLTALERLSKSEYNNQLQDLIAPLQDQLIQMTSEPLVDLQNAILAALILNNLGEEWNSAILDRGIERTRLRQAADFMEKIGF